MVNLLNIIEQTRYSNVNNQEGTYKFINNTSSSSSSCSIKESIFSLPNSISCSFLNKKINNNYQNYCKFRQASHSNNKYINKECHLNHYLSKESRIIPHFLDIQPPSTSSSNNSFDDECLLINNLNIDGTVLKSLSSKYHMNNSKDSSRMNLSKELSSSIDSLKQKFNNTENKSFICSTPCNYLSPKKSLSPNLESLTKKSEFKTLGVPLMDIDGNNIKINCSSLNSTEDNTSNLKDDLLKFTTTKNNSNGLFKKDELSKSNTSSSLSSLIMQNLETYENFSSNKKRMKKNDSFYMKKTKQVCDEANELNKKRVNLSKHDEKIRENFKKLKKKINTFKHSNKSEVLNDSSCNTSKNSISRNKLKLVRKKSNKIKSAESKSNLELERDNKNCFSDLQNSTNFGVGDDCLKSSSVSSIKSQQRCRPIHIKIKLNKNSFKKMSKSSNDLSLLKTKKQHSIELNNNETSSSSDTAFRNNIGQDEKKLIKFIYGQQYEVDNDNNNNNKRPSIMLNNGTIKSNRVKFNDIIEMYDPGLKNRSSYSMTDVNMSLMKSINLAKYNKSSNYIDDNKTIGHEIQNSDSKKLMNESKDSIDFKEKNQLDANDYLLYEKKMNLLQEFRINKLINSSPTQPLPPTPPINAYSDSPLTVLDNKFKKLSKATQTMSISVTKPSGKIIADVENKKTENSNKFENDKIQESTANVSNIQPVESEQKSQNIIKPNIVENVNNSKLQRADSFERNIKSNLSSNTYQFNSLGLADNQVIFRDEKTSNNQVTIINQSTKKTPTLRRVVEIKTTTLPDFKYQKSTQPSSKFSSNKSDSKSLMNNLSNNNINNNNESLNVTRELEVNIELKTHNNDSANSEDMVNEKSNDKTNSSIVTINQNETNNIDTATILSNTTTNENTSMNNFFDRQKRIDAFRRRPNFRSHDQYEQELNEIFKKMYDRHRSIHSFSDDNNSMVSNNSSFMNLKRSLSYTKTTKNDDENNNSIVNI